MIDIYVWKPIIGLIIGYQLLLNNVFPLIFGVDLPMVNKTGFNILMIETNALLGKRLENAGCSTFYLFLKNFAEFCQHIAS